VTETLIKICGKICITWDSSESGFLFLSIMLNIIRRL
jgi:hypothetical protein